MLADGLTWIWVGLSEGEIRTGFAGNTGAAAGTFEAKPMAKKTSAKPRPKRLRLVNRSPIGLSDEQRRELSEKYRPMARVSEFGVSIPEATSIQQVTLGRCLYIYIEALCHDARLENAMTKKGQTVAMRRQILRQIEQLCGREFSPDDIIRQLAKCSPVPKFAAEAIRRDFLRITTT
jgi:hypothetical protein